MRRPVLRLVLDVAGTVVLALVLLTAFQLAEGARVLFNFMDVGLAVWLILLVVWVVRLRPDGPSAGRTYLTLLVGSILNGLVVLVVGFVQGGWAPLLVLFAIQAGIASLIAAAVVVPLVHRLVSGLSSAKRVSKPREAVRGERVE